MRRNGPKLYKAKIAKPKRQTSQRSRGFLFLRWLKTGYGIISVIGTILGAFFLKDSIVNLFKSDHDQYIDQYYQSGIIIPGYLDNNRLITLIFGTVATKYSIRQLREGVLFNPQLLVFDEEGKTPWDLKLKVDGNRLLVSASIRYSANNEEIGFLDYNGWRLRKDGMKDYQNGNSFLEVLDKQSHVVFQLQILNANDFKILGYFLTEKLIVVVDEKGIFPLSRVDALDRALRKIDSITPILSKVSKTL